MDPGSGPIEAEGPGDVIPGEAADIQSRHRDTGVASGPTSLPRGDSGLGFSEF